MKPRQFAIASSIGANARIDRMVAASMTPAVACWLITSHAPSANTPDCRMMRRNRDALPKVAREVRCLALRIEIGSRPLRPQLRHPPFHAERVDDLGVMKRGFRHQPARGRQPHQRAGRFAREYSAATVIIPSATAPIVTANPINGWNSVQTRM